MDEEEMESSTTEGIRYETKSKYSLQLRDAASVAVTTVVVLLPLLRAKTKDAYTLCVRKEYNSKTILRSEKKSKLSIDTEYC